MWNEENTVIEQRLPQPDQPPHPALFSLETLYALQPNATRRIHARMVQQHQRETQSEIKRCDLELRGRHDESVFASDDFLVFAEQHEDYTDAQLEDYREHLQDRHIMVLVHRGLASAARARLLMAADSHEMRTLGVA